jgi:hypothetical protein
MKRAQKGDYVISVSGNEQVRTIVRYQKPVSMPESEANPG